MSLHQVLGNQPDAYASYSMDVKLVLDRHGYLSFTNLDMITGKVVLRTQKSLDLDGIVVKLEGESRTRLLSPAGGASGEKQRPQLEYHKILYRVQLVFPPQEVIRNRANSAGVGKNALTLPPGTHEYPFSFKLPFNNACLAARNLSPQMQLSEKGLEIAKVPNHHVKKTLPPTLSGFPGEAEIRYYVKATVSRTYFWKENPRVYEPFNFFPIEPPRPEFSASEVYARQTYSFKPFSEGSNAKEKVKALFTNSNDSESTNVSSEAPKISVDARLPEPAILTCNKDVPLRLIVKKLNDCNDAIFLSSLEISLVGYTKIRAHDVHRTETNSWIIISKSNLGIRIGAASDPVDTETVIDDSLWRGLILPKTVAPSFLTCNIERSYQLSVRVGLSSTGTAQSVAKPQNIVLLLRLDIQVFSGIAPPKELLEAMAEAKASIRRRSTADSSKLTEKLQTSNLRADSVPNVPPTPMESMGSDEGSNLPAYEGTRLPHLPAQVETDAPPSYEDAIASELPPVEARRPDYEPPPAAEDNVLGGDEKRRFGRRRDS